MPLGWLGYKVIVIRDHQSAPAKYLQSIMHLLGYASTYKSWLVSIHDVTRLRAITLQMRRYDDIAPNLHAEFDTGPTTAPVHSLLVSFRL